MANKEALFLEAYAILYYTYVIAVQKHFLCVVWKHLMLSAKNKGLMLRSRRNYRNSEMTTRDVQLRLGII